MDDKILMIAVMVIVPLLYLVPKALGLLARHRLTQEDRREGRMGKTLLGQMTGPLPGDIALIAQIGSQAAARDSAGTKVLRTTLGLRMISVGVSAAILAVLASGAYAGMELAGDRAALFWGLVILLGVGVTDILTYELQVDRHGMVLTRFGVWRRSFDWVHLMGIDDDQNYQYVLAFARGGRVKVLKHLVGMPHFLTVVTDALARNNAHDAGAARG